MIPNGGGSLIKGLEIIFKRCCCPKALAPKILPCRHFAHYVDKLRSVIPKCNNIKKDWVKTLAAQKIKFLAAILQKSCHVLVSYRKPIWKD